MPSENERKYPLSPTFSEASLGEWTRSEIRQGYITHELKIKRNGDDYTFAFERDAPDGSGTIEVNADMEARDFESLYGKGDMRFGAEVIQMDIPSDGSINLNDILKAVKGSHPAVAERTPIKQSHVEGSIRFRQEANQYFLTYKKWLNEESRLVELETPISQETFDTFWSECENVLQKTRYTKHDGDNEWVADFLKNPDGSVYFAMAEVEMPEDVDKPDRILPEIRQGIIAMPEKDDLNYTNKKLSDPEHAKKMLDMIYTDPQ